MKSLKIIILAWVFTPLIASAEASPRPATPPKISNHPKLVDIPAMRLGEALVQLAEQFNVNLLVSSSVLDNLNSRPLVGYYTLDRALTVILEDTPIGFRYENGNLSLTQQQNKTTTPPLVSAVKTPERIEEVIVSARLRNESKFDVPMSVSVTSATQQEKRGLTTLVDVGKQTSNSVFKVTRGTNSAMSAYVRGLGQDDPLAGFESGVGVYVNDVYINRPQAPIMDIYDISQVEILKGPQGTLYGRNTIGGAIKFVTARLPQTPTTQLQLEKGSYNQTDVVVRTSTPIENDKIRIGGSYADLNRDGFGVNRIDGKDNYDKAISASKLHLEMDGDRSSFRLGYDITNDESQPKSGHRLITDEEGNAPLSSIYDSESGLSFSQHPINRNKVTSKGYVASFDSEVTPYIQLRSITSKRHDKARSAIDFNSTLNRNLDTHVEYKNEQFSQEFRFTLSTEHSSTILGVYYLDAKALSVFDTEVDNANGSTFSGISFSLSDIETQSSSVFVDTNFDFNSYYSLSIGARMTQDEHKANISRSLFTQTSQGELISPYFGGDGFSVTAPVFDANGNEVVPNFSGSRKDRATTPRISLSRKTDSNHIYILHSQGYKSGNFDPRANYSAPAARKGFKPEYLTSQEFGLKHTNDQISFELSLFRNHYRHIQIPGSTRAERSVATGPLTEHTSNNAHAKIYGAETQISIKLNPHLQASLDSGILNSRYTHYISSDGEQVSDQRELINAPKQSHSLNIHYSREYDTFGTIDVNLQLNYSNDFFILNNQPDFFPKSSFHLYNIALVWTSKTKDFSAGLYGKNLHDERVVVDGYYFPTLGAITTYYNDPKTFSAKVKFIFN